MVRPSNEITRGDLQKIEHAFGRYTQVIRRSTMEQSEKTVTIVAAKRFITWLTKDTMNSKLWLREDGRE